MTNLSVKVAIIGAGYMAREHIRAFQNFPGVKVTGIYSRTFAKAEKLALELGIGVVCDSIDLLFERSEADLVVIAVPELSVREVCLEVFKYRWVCLIEKPAGYNVPDAEQIFLAAKENQRQAFVALNRRHYSSTKAVLSSLANQTERRIIHVYDQEDQVQAREVGQPELVIKNWMYANSIHLIDYFKILGRGEIIEVTPIIHWRPDNPSFVMAKIKYSSGDLGIYEAVWNGPGPWAVTVTTRQQRWELRPLEQAKFQTYGSRQLESIAIDPLDLEFKPGLCNQAKEAIKAANGLPHKLPSLAESLDSMSLAQAIYRGGINCE